MKKIVAIMLISIMAISLVACEDKKDTIDTPSAKDNDSVSDKSVKTETTIVADEDLKKEVEELKKQVSSLSQKDNKESVKSNKKTKQEKLDELYAETEKKYKPQVDALEKEYKELEKKRNEKHDKLEGLSEQKLKLIAEYNNDLNNPKYKSKLDDIYTEKSLIMEQLKKPDPAMDENRAKLDKIFDSWNKENEEIRKRVGN